MRILLVGDYSSVHLELRNYLKSQDYDVTLVSDGDSYKNFERDIDLKKSENIIIKHLLKNRLFRTLYNIYSTVITYLGLKGLLFYFKKKKQISKLKSFDIIQLMNTIPIEEFGSIASYLFIKQLLKQNPNAQLFLVAAGDDYEWVSKNLKDNVKSYFVNLNLKTLKYYLFSLRYIYGFYFKKLHTFILKNSNGIIPIIYDYYRCYQDNPKCKDIIPIGLSSDKFIAPTEVLNYPIKIFHGWQKGKDLRKGNILLHEAALKLQHEFGFDKIEYNMVQSVPYSKYITLYSDCDIFLDQCYSFGRGVNGCLGMAKGKIVVSGFELEKGLPNNEKIGVNAKPNIEYLYQELKKIVNNQKQLLQMKNNSYRYATQNYLIQNVANKYLKVWLEPFRER